MKISIKRSTLKDCLFFYNLRNNSNMRKISFNHNKINIKKHIEWYAANYKNNFFYTCYVDKIKSGYIRGEFKEDTMLISIAFLKKLHGKNIATESLKLFEKKIPKDIILIAKIKNDNSNSINFFIKNNFSLLSKKKSYLTYYKINSIKKNNYLQIVDKIEKIRKGNNVNWMNILRVGFRNSPIETSKIFKNIFQDDKKINKLSKKLF